MTKDIFMIPFSVCRNHIPIRRFKNRTVFILIALLSLVLFSGSISASVYSDIEILSSTDRSISFIAKIPEPLDHIAFGNQDSTYNLVISNRYSSKFTAGNHGSISGRYQACSSSPRNRYKHTL